MKGVTSLFLLALVFSSGLLSAQSASTVMWSFTTDPISDRDVMLSITAVLEPGWHIYSQYGDPRGPQPTRIVFRESDAWQPIEGAKEWGKKKKYFDDIYETDVIWYRGVVSFRQRIRLRKPPCVIRGRIEYLTCDGYACIPGTKEFSVEVSYSSD